MQRPLILSLLLLAATRTAGADDTATSTPAVSAPAAIQPAEATKSQVRQHPAKMQAVSTKAAADGKADTAAAADEAAQPGGDVKMSGISILGNEDAPKSLVLVPWKSSQLGDMPGVARLLDASTQPVDKDVFMRELAYYEFKSGSK